MEVESHLVSDSALVGHNELRKIARDVQAIRLHFFHCPAPTIARLRLKEVERQGCRLWIYDLCCERHLWFSLFVDWVARIADPARPQDQLSRRPALVGQRGSAAELR